MALSRLKSASMVALVAAGVVVGLSLPAAAHEASHLINGSSIEKHSISGNRLKNNAVTGSQVKESSLAPVPDANALGGVASSSYGKPVAFRVNLAKSAATAPRLQLAGIGEIGAGCAANGQPIVSFKNTTKASQDVAVTTTSPGNQPALSGPLFGAGANVSYQGSSMYWTFDARELNNPGTHCLHPAERVHRHLRGLLLRDPR